MITMTSPVPDQHRLARMGRKVRARLEKVPGIYRFPETRAELWALPDFMSPDECERLMRMTDEVAKPSRAFDVAYDTGYRTSYSGDADPNDAFVKRIQRRFDDLLGINPAYGETIQTQRYLPGQQFQEHADWFPYGTKYWDIEKNRGGQRCFTTMVFLNEVEEGGTTDFTQLGLSIEPKPGVLLIWNNADQEGVPNNWTVHAGTPVVKGVKYVVTKWYRVHPWV